MKKGTQKVETSDFSLMYYIKRSLTVSILSKFFAKCDLQVKMLIPTSVLKDKIGFLTLLDEF